MRSDRRGAASGALSQRITLRCGCKRIAMLDCGRLLRASRIRPYARPESGSHSYEVALSGEAAQYCGCPDVRSFTQRRHCIGHPLGVALSLLVYTSAAPAVPSHSCGLRVDDWPELGPLRCCIDDLRLQQVRRSMEQRTVQDLTEPPGRLAVDTAPRWLVMASGSIGSAGTERNRDGSVRASCIWTGRGAGHSGW